MLSEDLQDKRAEGLKGLIDLCLEHMAKTKDGVERVFDPRLVPLECLLDQFGLAAPERQFRPQAVLEVVFTDRCGQDFRVRPCTEIPPDSPRQACGLAGAFACLGAHAVVREHGAQEVDLPSVQLSAEDFAHEKHGVMAVDGQAGGEEGLGHW